MGAVFTVSGVMECVECYKCHVVFAMPQDMKVRLRQNGEEFFCPNGHGQVYSKPEIQELREALARERSRLEQTSAEAEDLREKNAKIAGKLSRVYKRVRNGVCPCCNRHFTNLENHMRDKRGKRNATKGKG